MSVTYFIISFVLTLIFVPICKWLAFKIDIVDRPNEARKIHRRTTPYLGGLAIYCSALLTYLIYIRFQVNNLQDIYMWAIALVVVLFGMYDDKFGMDARIKLLFQIIIAIISSVLFTDISRIDLIFFSPYVSETTGTIIGVIWIVAMMNAFNLMDGLDGLVGGLALVSLSVIFIISLSIGDVTQLLFVTILIGSILGFLFYNFYPAEIFLGDSGALLLGYFVSYISLGQYKTSTLTTTAIIFLIAFIPILDICLSVLRRRKNNQAVFKADSLHFHHRIMRKDFSHQQAVLIIYVIMIYYGIEALVLFFAPYTWKTASIVVTLIVTWLIVEYLYLLSDKYTIIRKFINRKIRKRRT
ncbi:MAG: glycosyltransferase family 4 protein [Mycoplasmatales bacterium]